MNYVQQDVRLLMLQMKLMLQIADEMLPENSHAGDADDRGNDDDEGNLICI